MAQRGDSTKPTRFKGPTVVTLRGAGSSGNDPLVKGAGTDVGLDIQVPVAQTANCFQITKPDGTVIYAIGPNGAAKIPVAITASGAVPVRPSADYVITDAGVAVLTLAAPTAGTDDGVTVSIISATAFAHTLTATGLLETGTASVNVATFAAFAGAGLTLKAYNGKWLVTSSVGITFS
jgi:hypothetical protein